MDLRALGRLNGNWSLLLLRLGVAPGLRGPLGWAQGGCAQIQVCREEAEPGLCVAAGEGLNLQLPLGYGASESQNP